MSRLLLAIAAGVLIAGCAQTQGSQARLIETYWKAVELESKPVEVKTGAREPHLVLRAENSFANGYSGCNTFRGGYELEGSKLRFKALATTRMACLSDGSDVETRFHAALNATAEQRVAGETLELRDQDGKVRARFESRYMK